MENLSDSEILTPVEIERRECLKIVQSFAINPETQQVDPRVMEIVDAIKKRALPKDQA